MSAENFKDSTTHSQTTEKPKLDSENQDFRKRSEQ
jgi:hypothetical protein